MTVTKEKDNTEKERKQSASPKKGTVVVLSRNYSTGLSVARSLGKAGYTVDMIASAYKPHVSDVAAASRYIRRFTEIVSRKVKDASDEPMLRALLDFADKNGEKYVLFPADDYTVSVMDMNRDVLAPYYVMPHIAGGGSLMDCMDKDFQSRLAAESGITVPKEWIISLREKPAIPEEIPYPCFCKPVESITGYKTEMAVCKNRRQLREHLNKLRKKFSDRSILVQEFLNIDAEIDLSGVCLDQEVIIPAIIRKTHIAKYERGVTMAGVLAPVEELGEIADKVKHMMQAYHYVGMFDLELNLVDGTLYFNEVNLRSGGPNYSYFKSGVNLPDLIVKELLGYGHNKSEESVAVYGRNFIYEKVAWEDYSHNFLTKKELNDMIASADIRLLNDEDDPEPYKLFLKRSRETVLRGKTKMLLTAPKRVLKEAKKKLKRFVISTGKRVLPVLMGFPQTKKSAEPRSPERPTVLVAGRNYCSNLSMARSLGKAGYRVEVMHVYNMSLKRALCRMMDTPFPDAYSKYVQAFYPCITRKKEKNIYRKLKLLAEPEQRILLIPTDDLVASVADRYFNTLSESYLLPSVGGERGGVRRMMKKDLQKELAVEFGIQVVNGCAIEVRRNRRKKARFEIPETVNYPCFIKPNVSMTSAKGKMQVCHDEKELKRALRKFSKDKRYSVMVEDCVEIAKELSILGVAAGESVTAPGVFVAEMAGKDERRGVAVTGRTLPSDALRPLSDKLVEFVRALNLVGMYDIDLIEDTEGKIYFAEINLRAGASIYAFTESGLNFPGMYADYMFRGKPLDEKLCNEQPDRTFVSERGLMDEYNKKLLSRAEVEQVISETDIHFIKDETDPRPYRHFQRYFVIAKLPRPRIKKHLKACRARLRSAAVRGFEVLLGFPQTKRSAVSRSAVQPTALVAGRNYCSNLSMARSLGKAGYRVEVMHVYHTSVKKTLRRMLVMPYPDAYSKYVQAFHLCVTRKKEKNIYRKLRTLRDPEQKMLLVPTDDLVASVVDRYFNSLREFYLLPSVGGERGGVRRMMKKDLQKELAVEFGIPVVNGCAITVQRRKGGVWEFNIPDTVRYPCFVKPNVSMTSAKSKMQVCQNEEELKDALRRFSRDREYAVMVEDCIEIAKEISILGVSTGENVLAPAVFVAEMAGKSERRGVAVTGRTLPSDALRPLSDQLAKFVRALDYVGMYDIDLIQDTAGNIYFAEINLRAGASVYAFTESGLNFPGMYADWMFTQKPLDESLTNEQPNRSFVSERGLLEEYSKGLLSRAEVERVIDETDIHFIKDAEDPKPFRHFRRYFLPASLLRLRKH